MYVHQTNANVCCLIFHLEKKKINVGRTNSGTPLLLRNNMGVVSFKPFIFGNEWLRFIPGYSKAKVNKYRSGWRACLTVHKTWNPKPRGIFVALGKLIILFSLFINPQVVLIHRITDILFLVVTLFTNFLLQKLHHIRPKSFFTRRNSIYRGQDPQCQNQPYFFKDY